MVGEQKMNKRIICIGLVLLFLGLFGCIGSDTFIIQNKEYNLDLNIEGNPGQIPIMKDNNSLEVITGFDFNKDTNTLSTKNISTRIIYNDNNNEWGTIYCPDGNIIIGYIEGFSC